MKKRNIGICRLWIFTLLLPLLWLVQGGPALAMQAQKGYLYEKDHGTILARAKKEGAIRALMGVDPASITGIHQAFTKKYPFIDAYFEEITGTEGRERFLLELQSGRAMDWDVIYLSPEIYNKLRPFIAEIDLLAMAHNKVLAIPTALINPEDRNAISVGVFADIAAFNSKQLKASDVPTTWEGFLKPELKGKKFVLDVKPNYLSGLVPAKGMEWLKDYARKLAAQDPIWARGQTRTLTAMAAGEYSLTLGTYYHSLMRARGKGMTNLDPVFVEPVPIRMGEVHAVRKGAKRPYAAILLLEFMGSSEGQNVIDETDPAHASVFTPGSMLERVIAGRKLSVLGWEYFDLREGYVEELFKAYGFPTATKRKK